MNPVPAAEPDHETVSRHLRRLATAYPDFIVSRQMVNPHRGKRWVADRIDRTGGGLITVITDDLLEMHAALQKDKAASHVR